MTAVHLDLAQFHPFLGLAGSIVAAVYAVTCALVASRFTSGRRCNARFTPADFGLHHETVRLHPRGDRLSLSAWYLAAESSRGAVVFVHGRDASKGHEVHPDAMGLVGQLLADGLSVLMLDLRGHGESDSARMTYGFNERRDVLGAVDWLRARGYAAGRIGVFGASMGGVAVLAAAAEEPAIGAVVSDSAFADFGAVLRLNFPRVLRTRLALVLLPGALLIVRCVTGAALGRFRPVQLVKRLGTRPLMLIHSAGDCFIPATHARQLADAAGRPAWITPTQGHVASFESDPQGYVERVRAFYVAQLLQAPAVPADSATAPTEVDAIASCAAVAA